MYVVKYCISTHHNHIYVQVDIHMYIQCCINEEVVVYTSTGTYESSDEVVVFCDKLPVHVLLCTYTCSYDHIPCTKVILPACMCYYRKS